MLVKRLNDEFGEKIKWVNYCWLFVLFAFNFLGDPSLKYVFLGYSCFVFLCILLFTPRIALPLIISYGFVEGQGRILWGYHPASRIAFDVLIVIATLRGFITSRDIKISKLLPNPMLIIISLHFLWYIVEFFNLDSVSMFSALAGTKIYIFPFFLLIFFRKNEDLFELENLAKIGNLIVFLLLMESVLGLYQLQKLESFMLGISSHYYRAMKGTIFTLEKFRPFGTTHLPGAISVFIFLTAGLIFVREKISKTLMLILTFVYPLFFVVLIVCQVRSGMLKFIAVLVGILISLFINARHKTATFFRVGVFLLISFPILSYYFYPKFESQIQNYVNLEAGLNRWEGFDDAGDVAAHRIMPGRAFDILSERLDKFPMGIGPGMTGAAASLSIDLVNKDPVYNKDTIWAWDNFYLSLFFEFGYGAVFYLAYFFCVPIALIYYYLKLYFSQDHQSAKIVSIALINVLVILLGNWGAIGIPYNPESFYFWFWTAIGFNTFSLAKNRSTTI